ncbi:MAG: hypothetical protein ACLUOF_11345 [Ruminococcus sp.]
MLTVIRRNFIVYQAVPQGTVRNAVLCTDRNRAFSVVPILIGKAVDCVVAATK